MSTPSSPARQRVVAATLFAATFLVGVGAGYGLSERRNSAGDAPAGVQVRVTKGIPAAFESLDLTSQQRTQITDILSRARPRTDSALRALIPRLRAITDSVEVEIRAVLTAEQRERLSKSRASGEPVFVLKRAPGGGAPVRVDTVGPN